MAEHVDGWAVSWWRAWDVPAGCAFGNRVDGEGGRGCGGVVRRGEERGGSVAASRSGEQCSRYRLGLAPTADAGSTATHARTHARTHTHSLTHTHTHQPNEGVLSAFVDARLWRGVATTRGIGARDPGSVFTPRARRRPLD